MTLNLKIIVQVDADLKELIPGFINNRHKDVNAILQAVEQGDYETVRFLGHSMKGAGGGYGFDTVSDIGRSLEQAAEDRDAGEIRKQVRELLNYLDRVEIVYV